MNSLEPFSKGWISPAERAKKLELAKELAAIVRSLKEIRTELVSAFEKISNEVNR